MSRNEAEIFDQARKIKSKLTRRQFLDQVCIETQLRDRIELLLVQDQHDSFLEYPLSEMSTFDQAEWEREGTTIGPYKLLEPIAQGGMGTVYLAQQFEPVRRRIAIKLIRPGIVTGDVIARFEVERQALALMEHPNIARLHDAGTTDNGNPYFVMENVPGLWITQFCDKDRLTLEERLILFRTVCLAVQHAHQKGIIHRDLKPSNILVTTIDNQAVPKIIDFGLAKATGTQLTDHTLHTRFGQLLGTFQYMSPEQTGARGVDIDTRSDIYSLGAILFELLVGSPPFEVSSFKQRPLDEVIRMIRDEDPPTPKRRLAISGTKGEIAGKRRLDVDKMNRMVKGDLERIVMRSLEKDPKRRYQTAAAFAEEIGRFIEHRPVEARAPSIVYRSQKFVRRNRVAVAVASGVLVTALIGILLGIWKVGQTRDASRAQGLVASLMTADIEEVPQIIDQLSDYANRSVPLLRSAAQTIAEDSPERLRIELAMLELSHGDAELVKQFILDGTPEEIRVIRSQLADHFENSRQWLWSRMETAPSDLQLLNIASTLAFHDPDNLRWHPLADRIVAALISANPLSAPVYVDMLSPVAVPLKDSLLYVMRNVENQFSDAERDFVADVASKYFGDDADVVIDFLLESDPSQFNMLIGLLLDDPGAAITRLERELKVEPAPDWNDDAIETVSVLHQLLIGNGKRDADAKRKSNAAIALIRMDHVDTIWPLLRPDTDLSLSTWLIHRAPECGVPLELLVSRLRIEPDAAIRQALVFMLGDDGYSDQSVAGLEEYLLELFQHDPDSGIHSAVEWALKRRGRESNVVEVQDRLAGHGQSRDHNWYVSPQGFTMVKIRGPVEFIMGDHLGENHSFNFPHQVRISRSFAVSTEELSQDQVQRIQHAFPGHLFLGPYSESGKYPQGGISWIDAAKICRLLSELENIPDREMCFPPVEEIKIGMVLPDDYLQRTGYRLPTEAEWEYVARGRQTTIHPLELSPFLVEYAWYAVNARGESKPVGLLKPNDIGLFDIAGNVAEWCVNGAFPYPIDGNDVVREDDIFYFIVSEGKRRQLRGATFSDWNQKMLASYRNGSFPLESFNFSGVRLVRTIREEMGGSISDSTFNTKRTPYADRVLESLEQEVANSKSAFGNEHRYTATSIHYLARHLVALKRTDEAIAKMAEVDVKKHQKIMWQFARLLSRKALWGDWKTALHAFKLLRDLEPHNEHYHRYSALLSVETGDIDDFHDSCERMLDVISKSKNPSDLGKIPFACTILPGANHDLDLLQEYADQAVQATESRGSLVWTGMVKSIVAYRRGDFETALECAKKFDINREERYPSATLLIVKAMAEQKLGRVDMANASLKEATELMKDCFDFANVAPEPYWADWLQFMILFREAEQLIMDGAE